MYVSVSVECEVVFYEFQGGILCGDG